MTAVLWSCFYAHGTTLPTGVASSKVQYWPQDDRNSAAVPESRQQLSSSTTAFSPRLESTVPPFFNAFAFRHRMRRLPKEHLPFGAWTFPCNIMSSGFCHAVLSKVRLYPFRCRCCIFSLPSLSDRLVSYLSSCEASQIFLEVWLLVDLKMDSEVGVLVRCWFYL